MKVSTWLGSILLLLALAAAFVIQAFEGDALPPVVLGPAVPGTIELRVGCASAADGQFGRFISGAAEILARELQVDRGQVRNMGASSYHSPFSSGNSSQLNCPVDQVDLAVLEPALYGLAIDTFDWAAGECQVLLRLCHQTPTGDTQSRDLLRRDGHIMWVDSPPTP